MEAFQEAAYEAFEANRFFERCQDELSTLKTSGDLRPAKKEIFDLISRHVHLDQNSSALEIGCFVGDLLAALSFQYQSKVIGVEPSSKAVEFAKNTFDLDLQNTSFQNSNYFRNHTSYASSFDLIILEDVLSWMPRQTLLITLGLIDYLLKPEGYLVIRDFSPPFSFAFQNHHVKEQAVFNYKQSSGHKNFFLQTGMYLTTESLSINTSSLQKISTKRPDATLWDLCLLKKLSTPLHPVQEF